MREIDHRSELFSGLLSVSDKMDYPGLANYYRHLVNKERIDKGEQSKLIGDYCRFCSKKLSVKGEDFNTETIGELVVRKCSTCDRVIDKTKASKTTIEKQPNPEQRKIKNLQQFQNNIEKTKTTKPNSFNLYNFLK